MVGRFDLDFRRNRDRVLTAGRVFLAVTMLAGCSSVPDAINPVEWYKSAESLITGDDENETASANGEKQPPAPTQTADTRKGLAKGLPADKSNSKYAEPVRREITPTKALARRTPPPPATPEPAAAAEPQVAAVPPKPAVTAQELPPAQAAQPPQTVQAAQAAPAAPAAQTGARNPHARDDAPATPPASVNMTPPPPADVPETVPMRGRRPLQEQYQRRLAESAQQTLTPGMVAMPERRSAALTEEEPIHLVPPSTKRSVKGGGKGLAAPAPTPEPAASFQVATLDFKPGSSDLTAADRTAIAEVARLYKQTGGVVRVVAHAPAPVFGGDPVNQMMDGLEASMKRANAVARELTKRGVPARKIMVGADPAAPIGKGVGAQIYLDVL